MSKETCFACHECIGPVPAGEYKTRDLCSSCKAFIENGVIIIGIDIAKTTDNSNPYRTGKFVVVSDDTIRHFIEAVSNSAPFVNALNNRLMFLDEVGFETLGLNEKMDEMES